MSLVLDSLEIRNFRAFKHLRIEKLGRVNLIVGKNNVGKSSVLEAIWLYAVKVDPTVVMQLLQERDELRVGDEVRSIDNSTMAEVLSALRHLFHGRGQSLGSDAIQIGSSANGMDNITIGLAQSEWVETDFGYTELRLLKPGEEPSTSSVIPSITVDIGQNVHLHFPLDKSYLSSRAIHRPAKVEQMAIKSVIVSDDGLTKNDTAIYWDSIVLSNLQDDVLSALKIIAPGVTGINLIGAPSGRVVIVKTDDWVSPVPLRSMGEGMSRMFGIALALVNAKDGMLLIDEVDTGLHYSVLPDLWKLIFEVAHRLNVQVFATTHSKDCLDAFQYAADENTEEEGVLIRLENRKAGVGAVTFDEEELAIVTRERIEVR